MKRFILVLMLGFTGGFSFGLAAQKLWPIEGHEGHRMLQVGPNHFEAWLGNGSGAVLGHFESEALPMPFSPTHFLPLSWVDIRNLVRIYETGPEGPDSVSFFCLESLENWQFKTECFDSEKGNWSYSLSRDARPSLLLRSAGFNTEQEHRLFLQTMPCSPQDSLCRRLAMPALRVLLYELDSVASTVSHEHAAEVLMAQHQLQAFLENGAGKTLLDFRKTAQAQAFFNESAEINALWMAYDYLAQHYEETRRWGPALLLLNTLKRLRPNDEAIQRRIIRAEKGS
jgi:hypothetical protein